MCQPYCESRGVNASVIIRLPILLFLCVALFTLRIFLDLFSPIIVASKIAVLVLVVDVVHNEAVSVESQLAILFF